MGEMKSNIKNNNNNSEILINFHYSKSSKVLTYLGSIGINL